MKRRLILAGVLAAAILAAPVIGKNIAQTVRAEEEDISAEGVVPFADVAINETNFPDEIFRNIVKSFDKDKNNKLSEAEIANVQQVYVYSQSIKSLKGVEYFTLLKELYCSRNQLTSLDISKNTMLEELVCNENQLTSLDVSKNTYLKYLDCYNNQLTSLDVSKNTYLKNLQCWNNKLTSLDVSKNTNLTELWCDENQLTSLDVSGCTALKILYSYNNQLTSLNVSKNTNLTELWCYNNQLTSLDVSKNTNLTELWCHGNCFTDLNIKNCALRSFPDPSYIHERYKREVRNDNGVFYYFHYREDEGIFTTDLHTRIWNDEEPSVTDPTPEPEPNSQSVEFNLVTITDLWDPFVTYSNNREKIDAINVLLQKCDEEDLFEYTVNSEKQVIYLDFNRDGKTDVYYYLGGFLMLVTDRLEHSNGVVFTEDQLQGTIYKEIAFVFSDYYTVTFDANGGSGEMDPQKYIWKKLILPECGFTAPKGKEFDGWNLGKPGDSVEITSDTVLEAQWKDIIYSVNVNVEGKGIAMASVDSGAMGTEVTLKAQASDGYKFKEWQVISGGVTITDDKFVIGTEDVEIKAIFEALPATPTPTNTPTPKPDDPTPTPKPDDPTPTPIPDKEPSIADFVERLYTIALNRASEPEGKAFWVKEIEDGNRTGGDCAYFFLIEAPEFKNRGLSDEDFVETLYKTFFDRASEAEGKAFWVGQLKNKTMTRDQVIMGFIDSKEWCNVCADYGVKSGAPTAKAERASKNAINFATRLYTCCLGRTAEDGGLKYWSLALTNLEQTGCSAAKEFFTSTEFVNLKLKDDEYVKRLYKTFMDREPEAGEVSYWTGEIAKGTQTRSSVLAFFGQSEEFTNICKKYGIDRGTM